MQEKKWVKIETPQAKIWNGKDEEGVFALKEGDILEGVFVEARTGLGPRKNASLFIFKDEAGEEVGVWGSAVLAARLGSLKEGEEVKIIYLGDVKSKTPGNAPYHNYEVYHTESESSPLDVATEDIPIIEE